MMDQIPSRKDPESNPASFNAFDANARNPSDFSGNAKPFKQPGGAWNGTLIGASLLAGLAVLAMALRPSPQGMQMLGDRVDQQTVSARAEAFRSASLAVQTLSVDQVAEAVRSSPDLSKHTDLISVFVWDDLMEDGDVITLESSGISRTVKLTKAGTWVILPKPSTGILKLLGNIDGGGGGITLGLRGSGQPVFTPVLAPGETLNIPTR